MVIKTQNDLHTRQVLVPVKLDSLFDLFKIPELVYRWSRAWLRRSSCRFLCRAETLSLGAQHCS